jgi:hypothetical protein
VPGVPVLRRARRPRCDGDFADAKAVACGAAVFQDPHGGGTQAYDLTAAGGDDRFPGHVLYLESRSS